MSFIVAGKEVQQLTTSSSGTKWAGLYRPGTEKFSLKGNKYVQEAIDAFNLYSNYGSSKVSSTTQVTENLTYFLYALDIISGHEGGFDSYNTYDAGGLSIGLIQFANPKVGSPLINLLNEMQTGLGTEVAKKFSGAGPFNKPVDIASRLDKSLCSSILSISSTSNSIKLQLKYVIDIYYDPAYKLFLSLVKPKIKAENNNLFVYANAFMFDCIVNTGNLTPFNEKNLAVVPSNSFTEGNFIYKMSAGGKVKLNLPQRDNYWNGTDSKGPFNGSFTEGVLPG